MTITIRDMTPHDEAAVLSFAAQFYDSPAVDHCVSVETLRQVFLDAVAGGSLLRGLLLEADGQPAGYAYLSMSYACEVAGLCVVLEEVYFSPEFRSKGGGTAFFSWMFAQYPQARRFRLEVTQENTAAIALYQRLGFRFLSYGQMVLEI